MKGKSSEQAQREYICYFAGMDADFAALLQKVLEGKVTQIKEAPAEVEMSDEIA